MLNKITSTHLYITPWFANIDSIFTFLSDAISLRLKNDFALINIVNQYCKSLVLQSSQPYKTYLIAKYFKSRGSFV